MTSDSSNEKITPAEVTEKITCLLESLGHDGSSAKALLPLVYDQLRALARARMAKEAPGQTLQATGLVHEAYLRVVADADPGWKGRGHFFGAAAQAMRRILVEQARHKNRLKRGGGRDRVELEDLPLEAPSPEYDPILVEDAVRRLESADPRKGAIVNLRYFAGLTNEETAKALDVSVGTVEREWRFIKAWLRSEVRID